MNAERSRLATRKSERIGPQALFVKPMTGLVEHAEQGGGKIRLVPARGESAVVRPGSATKRVLRGVDPPTGEVEADCLRHHPDERLLGCAGKMLSQQVVPRRAARSTTRPDKRHDPRAQPVEERRDVARPGAWFVVVEEDVVGIEFGGLTGCLLPLQPHDTGEVRGESLPVRMPSGFDPRLLAIDAGPRDLLHQSRGQSELLVKVAEEAEDGDTLLVAPVALAPLHRGGEPLEAILLCRFGTGRVNQGSDGSGLVGAVRPASRRQHRLLVPAEERFDRGQHRRPPCVGGRSGILGAEIGGRPVGFV